MLTYCLAGSVEGEGNVNQTRPLPALSASVIWGTARTWKPWIKYIH